MAAGLRPCVCRKDAQARRPALRLALLLWLVVVVPLAAQTDMRAKDLCAQIQGIAQDLTKISGMPLKHALGVRTLVWIQLVLATVPVLWGGWPFFERAGASLRTRSSEPMLAAV